ncbi:MAG: alpha/beta fold hydrolase [Deltaproteobacteria bacterium]|nr:alpha/beta fold hydrolase [Deltaproteobacteria bacterium]
MPQAQVGELELCYRSEGHGRPLLLVMGLGAQLVFWPDALCRSMVERGYQVVRFDNRDAGESSRLDHLPVPDVRRQILRWTLGRSVRAPYGLDAMADDAVGLLDALALPAAHVVGVSMGGMIAQLMALRHPSRVLSLTSVMSHPGDRLSMVPRPRALRALFRPVARTRVAAQDAWVQFFRTVGSTGFPFDEAELRHRAGLHFDRGTSPRGFVRHMVAVLAARDRRPQLRALDIPALVVHGDADPLVPPRGGVQTARALPHAELIRIAGMGHDLPRGAWTQILDALDRVTEAGEARRDGAS